MEVKEDKEVQEVKDVTSLGYGTRVNINCLYLLYLLLLLYLQKSIFFINPGALS